MKQEYNIFLNAIRVGALVDISKIVLGITLGAGAVMVLASVSGINLTTLECLGVASLILHALKTKKYLYNLFFTKRLLKDLNVTIVTNEDDMKKVLEESKKDEDTQ